MPFYFSNLILQFASNKILYQTDYNNSSCCDRYRPYIARHLYLKRIGCEVT